MNNLSIAQLLTELKAAHPELNGRVERATNLVQRQLVRKDSGRLYNVGSQSGNWDYLVHFELTTDDNPGWHCTCPDVKNGAPRIDFYGSVDQPICKHIVAVEMAETLERATIRTQQMTYAETMARQAEEEAAKPVDDYAV